MIYGIGTDITEVRRFERWVSSPGMCARFFSRGEIMEHGSLSARCQHYAVRFAAKEAFSKALGTGISFDLRDVSVGKDPDGRPFLSVTGSAMELMRRRCGDCKVHVSLSHEREYAVATVIIEKTEK